MKKFFAVIAAFAVCFSVSSCGDTNTLPEDTSAIEQYIEQLSETARTEETTASETAATAELVATVTASESSAEESSDEKPDLEAYSEGLLIDFLEYLQKPEKTDALVFEFWYAFPYDFMDDFTVDICTYEPLAAEEGAYRVTLNCSESSCDIFPDGESYWYFNALKTRFCRYEEKDAVVPDCDFDETYRDDPNYETIRTVFDAACTFSLGAGYDTPLFEADEEWFGEPHRINLHLFYHRSPCLTYYEDGGVYPDEFIEAIEKLYNITLPENRNYKTDENGRIYAYCAHGGTWYYTSLAGYEETESEIRVTVNFYGDELYFYPASQSEYSFSKNEDGTVTLQRVENIFDRGYELAVGTV